MKEWVPPVRLKVPWADDETFRALEARWAAVLKLSPDRDAPRAGAASESSSYWWTKRPLTWIGGTMTRAGPGPAGRKTLAQALALLGELVAPLLGHDRVASASPRPIWPRLWASPGLGLPDRAPQGVQR